MMQATNRGLGMAFIVEVFLKNSACQFAHRAFLTLGFLGDPIFKILADVKAKEAEGFFWFGGGGFNSGCDILVSHSVGDFCMGFMLCKQISKSFWTCRATEARSLGENTS